MKGPGRGGGEEETVCGPVRGCEDHFYPSAKGPRREKRKAGLGFTGGWAVAGGGGEPGEFCPAQDQRSKKVSRRRDEETD
jgi:hypothetical protein